MTHSTSTPISRVRGAATLGLAAVLMATAVPVAQAKPGQGGLTGAWMVEVTLRNCDTGAPLGPAFNSLVTFHADGTISETAGSVTFAPGQRSQGHGEWTRTGGHKFDQDMVAMILFDSAANLPGTPGFDPSKPVSPGFFAGWQAVDHSVQLVNADRIESSGTNAFYRANGELYRSGCSTATGRRF